MEQDWIHGLIGGLMIGGAAAIYLLVNGKIMGASGILGGLADSSAKGQARAEKLAFLAGLIAVPGLLVLTGAVPAEAADTHVTGNLAVLVAAGLLVGLGTRLAGGCTSGHGVCGISRLSPRGLAATAAYLAAGVLTLLVFRQLLHII
ncbi:YeeE/YedE family protein [Frigidibacter sp.]|uniref:YeeE/YedE family protein n=1 Tax=Frigidibacter sp. TaxID=2586418 RepID=UPI002733CB5B|nr:YeeE/YedE family protein [Frigidibacter sp.]MDP3340071.1 YeeE/YedE family protein [Frigidibacter sp.]